jgi:ribonuclease R
VRPEKAVLKALRDARTACTDEEVAEAVKRLGIEPERTRRVLRSLVASGAVAVLPDGRYLALKERNLLVGRLSMHRRGFAFVSTPLGEVYVARRDTGGALHGDTVAVRLHTQRARERRSGEVVQVLERGVTHVVGRLERHGALGIVVPTDPRIRHEVFVDMARSALEARDNDVVVVRVTRYPTRRDAMQGVIEEVLGPADAPGVDIEIVIREHGLRTAFSPEAIAAAETLAMGVDAELAAGRPDLRHLFTVTIDPVDAKDFDDAISIERLDGGGFRLWVHIADVSHYVRWDDPVDEEARVRATSVYLADRVLPMLPERISNDLCSLRPNEDRLAFTVEFECDARGSVGAYRLYPSVIRSDRRLDYDSVDGWLERGGFPDAETERLLLALRDLAAQLHARRIERGGLDFETVEARVTLDEDGRPTGVTLRRRTVATNMIEEAMIAANEVVARHMRDAGAPMMYRIHEDPEPEALDELAVVLKEFDYPIKDVHGASPQTFQRIVAFAHGRPEELLINSLLIRALERARYSALLESHFGLASEAYCHFTSPIRRYPDLIVHRLLKAQLANALDKEPAASIAPELDWLAEHCSVMEREAESAEDDSQRVKLVELMADRIGEVFDALITGVMSFGMFVQLENTAEGLVHVKAMADDYYTLDAERFMLIGERNGAVYRLGQRVRVRLIDANVAEKRLDFELA